MSFPRANVKRFNEIQGCAPPPGSYDPKQKDKARGFVVDKSERFKNPKDGVCAGANASTISNGKTPVKQLFPPPQGSSHKPARSVEECNSTTKALKNKMSGVMEENKKLKEEILAVRNEIKEVVKARKLLEEQRDNLMDSNENLKDQVKQMSTEQANRTEHLRVLTANSEELQAGTLILQQQLAELQNIHETKCRETEEKISSLQERETLINETTANLHERIVELQAQNEDLAATLRETGELLSRTKEENDKLEEMLRQAEANWETEKKQFLIQVEQLVFEKSRAESMLGDTEDKVKKMETDMLDQKTLSDNKIEELTNQLDADKAELVQLQNKLGDLVYEKSQLHTEVGHLEAQLKIVKCESEETVSQANKAMEIIPELKIRIETLDTEKAGFEKRAFELSEQNETLQTTLEKFQADFDEHSNAVEKERMETHSKIVALTEEVEGLREQKDQMANELDNWLTDKSELDIEIAKLQCRIKVLEMENEQVKEETQKEIVDCKDEIERVRKEKQQIEKDMEQYGIDLLSNAAQLQSMQAKLDTATTDSKKLETENTKMKEELEQKDVLIQDKQAQLDDLQLAYDSKCKDSDDIANEKEILVEELRVQKESFEDLNCSLQQTRADFIKRCNERDELVKKNNTKDKSLSALSEQVAQLTQELYQVNLSLKTKTSECDEVLEKCREQEKQLTLSSQQVSNYKQQIEDYNEHLQMKCEECEELQQKCEDYDIELTMAAREAVDLQERVESLRKESEAADVRHEEEIQGLKSQLENNSSTEELQNEVDHYKKLYEELQAKVEPFMDQIDSYEMEKQLLLGQSKDTRAEMERLGKSYVDLLSHQNHKQKIKHIEKIKNENFALKQEIETLRLQTVKQKRRIQKLEEKSAPPKKFDSSKAFQHAKENLENTVTSSPLKELNKK
ncbi:hyaluronan mediated motility receptor-like isoform X2 [Ruditapes philippinarum]|uniref:hyaluronan mediated motility receptor-like isoform X2 n=1 Tax=Ruditapes philippinarum TaxID=129788 RepID=UPI00295B6F7C|nr:hyaluronan mediated motility receptor-like isoform X2 [Ruditapes philippinarum]